MPLEQLEGARRSGVDRVARQHQHAVLARVQAVAPGIIAAFAAFAADRAVVVQVQAAGHAGVDRGQVAVGVMQRLAALLLRHFQVVALEQFGRLALRVEVELVDQHDIRTHALQDRSNIGGLLTAGLQLGDQPAGLLGIQRNVVGGQAQRRVARFGHRGGDGGVAAGGTEGSGGQEKGAQCHHRIISRRYDDQSSARLFAASGCHCWPS